MAIDLDAIDILVRWLEEDSIGNFHEKRNILLNCLSYICKNQQLIESQADRIFDLFEIILEDEMFNILFEILNSITISAEN